jgi:hypothetical protein
MEFSEYENIEIFNNTQSFGINKCENSDIEAKRTNQEENHGVLKICIPVANGNT